MSIKLDIADALVSLRTTPRDVRSRDGLGAANNLNATGDRQLLATCASACVDNSGSLAATFGYPRHAPRK